MDKLDQMEREIRNFIARERKKGRAYDFMAIKHHVLDVHNLQGEQREKCSSELSRRLGRFGGKVSAFKRKELRTIENMKRELQIIDAEELERDEAVRSGNLVFVAEIFSPEHQHMTEPI